MTRPGLRLAEDMDVRRWEEAVRARHSRRRYGSRPVPTEGFERLEGVVAEFSVPARVVVVRQLTTDIFRGIVGGYGKVTGASSAMVFLALAGPEGDVAAGYLGEAAILEATSLGLDTCWVGGFFRPEAVASMVALRPGERVAAVTPLGFAEGDPGAGERWMKRLARSHRRRPAHESVRGVGGEEWPGWARAGLESARLAPSAANRQPWRFRWEGGAVVVAADNPRDPYKVPKRLDCGIAMLHFEVGARSAGVAGGWTVLDAPDVASFRPSGPAGPPDPAQLPA